jgi:predicted O-linked N-acetylglucosamine transferase (SPINDLY family)
LTRVGLDSLIARDERDYVRLAADLAGDYRRRSGLRSKLRPMMQNSPLCDGPGFTRQLEEAYRGMVEGWWNK